MTSGFCAPAWTPISAAHNSRAAARRVMRTHFNDDRPQRVAVSQMRCYPDALREVRMYRVMGLMLVAFALTPVGVRAQSQATTGVIEGSVSDETGGRLPGANVTLTN